ncbi:MAG: xanthine dehydrogenase family protein subunit M [Deltaproteobacteria bacterium]|nr:xanthine dehydrogenase family protein subunit M [Deltaproteobacteria bacterium]
MKRFQYFKPQSLQQAWQLKREWPNAFFIAGGTDLMVQIKNMELSPPALISLRSIAELKGIETGQTTRIGALTTISDISQHPELAQKFPLLQEAARNLGSFQIRNVATIGGNLCNCSPSADMALPLLVLEAKLKLQRPQGTRLISVEELFKGPGKTCLYPDEILTDILLNHPRQNAKSIFLKKGRVKMDLALASLAVLLETEEEKCLKARLAAGSVAPVPLRLKEVEAMLEGKVLTEDLIEEAQELAMKVITPISDVRASRQYRRQILAVLVRRTLEKLNSIY